jgi:hypothetical protein
MKVTLLGHEFDALMDSGAGLSLISRTSVDTLMKSEEWKNCKQGMPVYKTDEAVSAVNCDGKPLTITGKLVLPTMTIGKHDLKQECEYWVMEGSVDEILIANRWLKPLQGALAYEGENQYLYFHLPNQKLTAGGRYAQKERVENNEEGDPDTQGTNEKQDEEETCEELEEAEDQNEEEQLQDGENIAQVHATTRVSTQPRLQTDSRARNIIEAHDQTTIYVKKKEADKLLLQFPNLVSQKPGTESEEKWIRKTQPVMVNNKTPGLITKWRAPFEE